MLAAVLLACLNSPPIPHLLTHCCVCAPLHQAQREQEVLEEKRRREEAARREKERLERELEEQEMQEARQLLEQARKKGKGGAVVSDTQAYSCTVGPGSAHTRACSTWRAAVDHKHHGRSQL